MIRKFKDIFMIRKMGFEHYIAIEHKLYKYTKILVWWLVFMNARYKNCEIYRSKYKKDRNIVVIGLRWNGRNVKRRTSGFAKDFVRNNRNCKCIYCDCKLTQENATDDHIIPISKGGNNSQINLMVCCLECNSERGNIKFITYLRRKNPFSNIGTKVFI
jgi:5-methylcytosine-specific restriction endonuclease McrA